MRWVGHDTNVPVLGYYARCNDAGFIGRAVVYDNNLVPAVHLFHDASNTRHDVRQTTTFIVGWNHHADSAVGYGRAFQHFFQVHPNVLPSALPKTGVVSRSLPA